MCEHRALTSRKLRFPFRQEQFSFQEHFSFPQTWPPWHQMQITYTNVIQVHGHKEIKGSNSTSCVVITDLAYYRYWRSVGRYCIVLFCKHFDRCCLTLGNSSTNFVSSLDHISLILINIINEIQQRPVSVIIQLWTTGPRLLAVRRQVFHTLWRKNEQIRVR